MKIRAIILLPLICLLFLSCASESSNRNKTAIAFEDNFDFEPPKEIKEIRVKNFALRDAFGHWMAFTYDENSLQRILKHDQPLKVAKKGTKEYREFLEELSKGANIPRWFDVKKSSPGQIFYKKDFLDHSFSEYYLFLDQSYEMVYLHVGYFD